MASSTRGIFLDGTGATDSAIAPTKRASYFAFAEARSDQVLTYYDQGVGTFGLKENSVWWSGKEVPSRVFGLAFGWEPGTNHRRGLNRFPGGELQETGRDLHLRIFTRRSTPPGRWPPLIRAVGLLPVHQVNLFD